MVTDLPIAPDTLGSEGVVNHRLMNDMQPIITVPFRCNNFGENHVTVDDTIVWDPANAGLDQGQIMYVHSEGDEVLLAMHPWIRKPTPLKILTILLILVVLETIRVIL